MISPIIGWYFKQRVKELRANIERSLENQNILFGELTEKLALTEYGQKFGIDKLTTYQEFAERVSKIFYPTSSAISAVSNRCYGPATSVGLQKAVAPRVMCRSLFL
jgi:hypothetical protein